MIGHVYIDNDCSNIKTLLSSTTNCYVNGIQNKEASYDRIDNFNISTYNKDLINIGNTHKAKIELNNFIGND